MQGSRELDPSAVQRYTVRRAPQPLGAPEAAWEHPLWQGAEAATISHWEWPDPDGISALLAPLEQNSIYIVTPRRSEAPRRGHTSACGARHSQRVSGAADNLILGRKNPLKCPNSAQPVECPVCAKFNEVSSLRHAKFRAISHAKFRAISHARFRARNFARFRRGKLMSRNGLRQRGGAKQRRPVDAPSTPSLQVAHDVGPREHLASAEKRGCGEAREAGLRERVQEGRRGASGHG